MASNNAPKANATIWQAARQNLEDHAEAALISYANLLRFHARTARLRSGTLRELGLTHARLRILAVVATEPNLSISQIARILDLSRQAVHRVVHEMARGGALGIDRRRLRQRACAVNLTALGYHIAALALPWEREWTSQILSDSHTEDLQGIAAVANHIRQKLPWTVRGPDDSATFFDSTARDRQWLRMLEPDEGEYAVLAAVSRKPQWAHP